MKHHETNNFVVDMPPALLRQGQSLSRVRRMKQQHLAKTIGRRRMAQPNPLELHQDGSNLVFRRHEHQALQNDWDSNCPYNSVTFLNQHDVVLAADTYGRIDVVRLPSYCPPVEAHDNCGSSRSFRPLGKQIASRLTMERNDMERFTFAKIKSLQQGHAFAVGMPSGQFQVFATEHAKTWGKSLGLPQSQVCLAGSQSDQLGQFRSGWCAQAPRRRYMPEYNERSLWDMARTFLNASQPNYYDTPAHEIERWNTESPNRPLDFSTNPAENLRMWDFRETSSTLLAAHVECGRDCFSVRIMDHRCSTNQRSNNSAVLCADKTSRNEEESVCATCFASDHMLVTMNSGSTSPRDDKTPSTHMVKWWDLRKFQRDKPTPVAQKVLLPSFPLDCVHCIEPSAFSYRHLNNSIIWSLTPSAEGVGSLLVTSTIRTDDFISVKHSLEDAAGTRVLRELNAKEYGESHILQHPCFAITPNHDFIATIGNEETPGESPAISWYDWSKDNNWKNRGGKNLGEIRTSRKRSVSERVGGAENDKDWSARVPIDVTDRHGMRSAISCMAFNDTGTSLVGGSEDGDLFLWRGG